MNKPTSRKTLPYRMQSKGIAVIALSLFLALMPAGCGMTPDAVKTDIPTQIIEATPSPTVTVSPSSAASASPSASSAPTPGLTPPSPDASMSTPDASTPTSDAGTPTPTNGELPVVHREGFQNAELTFVLSGVRPVSDGRDPDEPYYYDAENQIPMPPLRESAQNALRQLYDLTGYQVERCNVLSTGRDLLFSMDQEFNLGSFFIYSIEPMSPPAGRRFWCLTISYHNGNVNSPIDAAQVAAPENLSDLTDEEIAKWYYENSAFGDRRRVVGTEPDHVGFIRLYLKNGDFYEATLHRGTRVIDWLYGPYEKGFEH